MAFSKDQKNQLSLMLENPKDFLKKCKEETIYLPGFNGEYFKDGTGIFNLLAEGVIQNKDNGDYLELFDYILEQDNGLSIFAFSGRKDSAFSLLRIAAKDNLELYPIMTKLLLKQKKLKNNDYFIIRSFVSLLGEKGFVKEIEDVLSKFEQIQSDKVIHQALLKSSIGFKQDNVLDYVLSNNALSSVLDEEIGTYQFNTSKPYNEARYGNIYTYCVSCENYNALFKLIDKFGNKINFDGTFKQVSDRDINPNTLLKEVHPLDTITLLKEIHPLDTILKSSNKEIFEKYYSYMDIAKRTEWLCTDHNRRINSIYRKSYHEVVLKDLSDIFTSKEVSVRDKLGVYNQLLYFSKDTIDPEKYQTIEKIINPLWDKIPTVNKATFFIGSKHLFDNFYSKGEMSEKEINAFVNIFKKIKDRGEFLYSGRLYSNSFFNEPQLAKKLLDEGLSIDVVPTDRYIAEGIKNDEVNVYEHYLHAYEQQKKNLSIQKADALNFDRVKETLRVLYENNPELVFRKTTKEKYILQIAIEQNCREIFQVLTVKDFEKFKELDGRNILNAIRQSYSPNQDYKDSFTICLDKLFKSGFLNRQEDCEVPQMFYYFLDKTDDFFLLDKIYKGANIDLNEEIQKESFWLCLNTENPAIYLNSRLTNDIRAENAPKILRTLTYANHQQAHLENLLNIFPNIHKIKVSDGDNILHSAIKNGAYKLAEMIVGKFPDLAIEANQKNKMPISYMISSFAKDIEKNKGRFSFDNKKKHEQLFDSLINCGLESPNKKANKILDGQLEKYSVIKENFPQAITTYEYQKLNRALHKNNAPSGKRLKI